MKKLGRNDPCGSGKKYKQCCLKSENIQRDSDRSEAVPKAIQWLFTKYGQIAREALHEGFFGGLDDDDYAMLEELPGDSYEGIMINAMEWFLAEGIMTLKGQDHRVADLLLGRGGPSLLHRTAAMARAADDYAAQALRNYHCDTERIHDTKRCTAA